MNLFNLVVGMLALWRVTSLLSNEEGPGNIFIRLRAKMGVVHDDTGRKLTTNGTYLAELIYCPWCLSVVLALPYVVMWGLVPDIALWLGLPFALSAGSIALENTIGYGSYFKKR